MLFCCALIRDEINEPNDFSTPASEPRGESSTSRLGFVVDPYQKWVIVETGSN